MKELKSKEDAKRYARLLKNFYGELYTYILTNAAIIFLWFAFWGDGHFWPIWIVLIWGTSLLIKASKLHIIDHSVYEECDTLRERFLFMKKDWEEKKVEQLVKRAQEKGLFNPEEAENKAPAEEPKKAPAKKAAPKKAPAKKTAAKKPAVKKAAAPKKAPVEKK